LFANVVHLIGQKSFKEGSEPNGMSPNDDVLFLHGRGKDEIAKFPHAFQTVRTDRLVAQMETHVGLIGEGGLKVADFRCLVYP